MPLCRATITKQSNAERSAAPRVGAATFIVSIFAIAVIAALGRHPRRVRRRRQLIALTSVRANHSEIKKVRSSRSQLMRLFREFEPAGELWSWLARAVFGGEDPEHDIAVTSRDR